MISSSWAFRTRKSPYLGPESSQRIGPGQRQGFGLIDPGLFCRAIGVGITRMLVPRPPLHRGIGGGGAGLGAQIIPKGEMALRIGRAHGEEMELRHPPLAHVPRAVAA